MKMTASDLLEQDIIDGIIPEPLGGAHRDPDETALRVKAKLCEALAELEPIEVTQLVAGRYEKFRRIGRFADVDAH